MGSDLALLQWLVTYSSKAWLTWSVTSSSQSSFTKCCFAIWSNASAFSCSPFSLNSHQAFAISVRAWPSACHPLASVRTVSASSATLRQAIIRLTLWSVLLFLLSHGSFRLLFSKDRLAKLPNRDARV